MAGGLRILGRLLSCCIALPLVAAGARVESGGFSISAYPEWQFREGPLPAGRIFELYRVYPDSTAGPEALAGRVYLEQETSGRRLVDAARSTVDAVRSRHFEVRTREQRREAGFPVLYYRLFRGAPAGSIERDLWITIRFLRQAERNYVFWAGARSERELVESDLIFGSLRAAQAQ